jgi:succinate dehydrogenase/fumarate reductase flavoprotein subunit
VIDAFGQPIGRLFAAGELGSVFGHLYISGGNLAECFVGGWTAGRAAAKLAAWDGNRVEAAAASGCARRGSASAPEQRGSRTRRC